MKITQIVRGAALAGCAALTLQSGLFAQSGDVSITVGPKDQQAPGKASNTDTHPLWLPGKSHQSEGVRSSVAQAAAGLWQDFTSGFYPGDVANAANGPVVSTSLSHALYVNCGPSCWGNPDTFLTNLGKSLVIHVVDQYVGRYDPVRYTVGQGGKLTYPVSAPLGDNDILTIVHAGAAKFGTGYGHIYHVFLPPGVDVCLTGTSECYSPDNPSTFYFCAYHASVDFSDIGHTLFTVQPCQNVPGCMVQQPSPQGPLVDSTSNILFHETTETITDPDGDAWLNLNDLVMYGSEIADECEQAAFSYPSVLVFNTEYAIQGDYSNASHRCSYSPF